MPLQTPLTFIPLLILILADVAMLTLVARMSLFSISELRDEPASDTLSVMSGVALRVSHTYIFFAYHSNNNSLVIRNPI